MKTQIIQSRDNTQLKRLRALLTSARARQEEQLTVLEGTHLCAAWLRQQLPLQSVWVSEVSQHHMEIKAVLRHLPDSTTVYVLPEAWLQQISTLDTGAALCCIIEPLRKPTSPDLAQDCVVLDAVQDPGNVGSLLRTAAAAGVEYAWLGQGCASAWAPKTLRAGMGAQAVLNITEGVVLHELLPTLHATTVAADVHAPLSLYHMDLTSATAWVFGNEGQGLSDSVLPYLRQRVCIPQSAAVESMNVAAAAAVSLFEMRRQRLASTKVSN
jgi:TrmH family RNA methyltransferase